MINQPSQPRKGRVRFASFGLALVASLAFAGIAAGGASALSFTPDPAFTMQGGGLTLTTEAGNISSCARSTGKGKFSGGAAKEVTLRLEGCTLGSWPCTTGGYASGTIVTSQLTAQPVYLDAAKTKFGLLLSPPAGQAFATFSCIGVPVTWTGSLIGQVTKPALNVSSTQGELVFESVSTGVQKYQQIEGAGPKYHLTQTMGGGSPSGLALTTSMTLTFATEGKFIP